mmetsp:Transcript_130121/g.337437  ORF Transcript_130121/g.337437 Transcript_130121/m.337437 type:complete len:210 (-) Transcript_130121:29-658(-)
MPRRCLGRNRVCKLYLAPGDTKKAGKLGGSYPAAPQRSDQNRHASNLENKRLHFNTPLGNLMCWSNTSTIQRQVHQSVCQCQSSGRKVGVLVPDSSCTTASNLCCAMCGSIRTSIFCLPPPPYRNSQSREACTHKDRQARAVRRAHHTRWCTCQKMHIGKPSLLGGSFATRFQSVETRFTSSVTSFQGCAPVACRRAVLGRCLMDESLQ